MLRSRVERAPVSSSFTGLSGHDWLVGGCYVHHFRLRDRQTFRPDARLKGGQCSTQCLRVKTSSVRLIISTLILSGTTTASTPVWQMKTRPHFDPSTPSCCSTGLKRGDPAAIRVTFLAPSVLTERNGKPQISLLVAIPYVILQSLWAACFRRRGHKEVRDHFFRILTSSKILNRNLFWWGLIKRYAFIVYFSAVLVVLICAPLFIMCIVADELTLWLDLSSKEPYLIGQREPWATISPVLFAALIGNYHHSLVVIFRESWPSHGSKANRKNPLAAHYPRPFAIPPQKRRRTMTMPMRDTNRPLVPE